MNTPASIFFPMILLLLPLTCLAGKQARLQDLQWVKTAKAFLLTGDLTRARFYLNKVHPEESRLAATLKRYLAIIDFIEGDFPRSLENISGNEFLLSKNYRQSCLLLLINLRVLNERERLKREFERCSQMTKSESGSEHLWIASLLKPPPERADIFRDITRTKIWFKFLLYTKQEKRLPQYVALLPEFAYHSRELRELIGVVYYRLGDNQKALEFIEDINTPNSDNIRGNIALQRGDRQKALSHFRLALEKKPDSQNTLERAIALAWLTGQWDTGLRLLGFVLESPQNIDQKLAIESALNIRKGDFTAADKQIRLLTARLEGRIPISVELMESYVALQGMDKHRQADASMRACRRFDGSNCQLALQLLQWNELGPLLAREDGVFKLPFKLEDYKRKTTIVPLKEVAVIGQKDIEDMDSGALEP